MSHFVYVGNDVVDLNERRTKGRATDERFVGRVFDSEEQMAIRHATDPDVELWSRWAAKEAGFKAITKMMGCASPFVPRAFKVTWSWAHPGEEGAEESAEEAIIRRGMVRHDSKEASVSVALRPGGIHAVAFGPLSADAARVTLRPRLALLESPTSPWSGSLDELLSRFSVREADAVHSRESAAVRVGARGDLATLLEVSEDRLEIVCDRGPGRRPGPPRVLLDGAHVDADISLSHDGRWIAWATWVGAGPRAPTHE